MRKPHLPLIAQRFFKGVVEVIFAKAPSFCMPYRVKLFNVFELQMVFCTSNLRNPFHAMSYFKHIRVT